MVKKKVEEATPPAKEDVSKEGGVAEPVISLEEHERLLKDKTQGLERAVSEKAEQLRRLEASQGNFGDVRSEMKTLREEMTQQIQLIAMMQAEGRPAEEVDELLPKEKGDYLQRFQDWQTQQEAKRQQAEAQRKGDEYRRRVEALGLSPKDKVYRDLWRDVKDGFYDGADAQLVELEQAKVKAEAEPKGKIFTEADLETEKRKWAEEAGILVMDTGGPSGPMKNFAEIEKAYGRGEVSYDVYAQARKDNKID